MPTGWAGQRPDARQRESFSASAAAPSLLKPMRFTMASWETARENQLMSRSFKWRVAGVEGICDAHGVADFGALTAMIFSSASRAATRTASSGSSRWSEVNAGMAAWDRHAVALTALVAARR